MPISHLTRALERIAPVCLAEAWDNVGLLVGGADWPCRRVLLTIDLTDAVVAEAIEKESDAIVAYHPPIFAPLKALRADVPGERVVLEAARRSIAIHSPHTALDSAQGGLNDWLAEGCGPGVVAALTPDASLPASEALKIVTFVPPASAGAVRRAMSEAGAGRIGAYRDCSFEIPGTGTFFGGEGASPAIGRAGRLERVEEVRLEMVAAPGDLPAILLALRTSHPYEEPPIEVYTLAARPDPSTGAGRRIVLERAAGLRPLVERIKRHLGVDQLRVAAPDPPRESYWTIGLCAGAGGSLLDAAIENGCELFLTGEMHYHDVLAAQARGCAVALAGHSNTERGYLPILARRLAHELPDVVIEVAKRDVYPLEVC